MDLVICCTQFARLAEYIKQIVEVKLSKIHGNGLFASADLLNNHKACLALKNIENNNFILYQRTNEAKYINHATDAANIDMIKFGNDYYFVTTRNIKAGEELFTDYQVYENIMQKEYLSGGKYLKVL